MGDGDLDFTSRLWSIATKPCSSWEPRALGSLEETVQGAQTAMGEARIFLGATQAAAKGCKSKKKEGGGHPRARSVATATTRGSTEVGALEEYLARVCTAQKEATEKVGLEVQTVQETVAKAAAAEGPFLTAEEGPKANAPNHGNLMTTSHEQFHEELLAIGSQEQHDAGSAWWSWCCCLARQK